MNVKLLLAGGIILFSFHTIQAQGLMGKLKRKAEEAAEKALEKKAKEKVGLSSDTNEQDQSQGSTEQGNTDIDSGSGRPTNTTGGGLISTPPDVNQNLADAETSYASGSYGEARYAVQQAMLGVELQIGKQVLESLPETVSELPKIEEEDKVTSTGYGWAGLTIQRDYRNDEKEFKATIANNAAWMSAVNMYLSNGGYAQTTGGEQNWKQTKLKGYRAIIEYDESSGYKLSVPVGQTSLIVLEGVNYASEQEMMDAAGTIDIDGIKKMLGEQ